MNRISRRKLLKFVAASQIAGLAGATLCAPGLATGVIMDGKLAHAKGFGVADMRQPKSVTDAAIMQLVDTGKKDIKKSVYAYIP